MISKRLKTVASFINKSDFVLDVGTDHAYLPIYLKENNLCKDVIASDVSLGAIKGARNNIENNHLDIKTFLTDGLNDIPKIYDTLVITGMGSHTIIHILENNLLPAKIILSSHNDLFLLRMFMNKQGYKINQEKVVLENGKYYVIIEYLKGKEKINRKIALYGKSNDNKYYNYLLNEKRKILKKVHFKDKIKMYYDIFLLKSLIK